MGGPSFGVEEEFLLVHPLTGQPVGTNAAAARHAASRGVELQLEWTTCQIEAATDKADSSSQLHEHISHMRTVVSESAAAVGARALAVGVPPSGPDQFAISDSPRYRRIAERFGMVGYEQCVSGCHVHVEVPNRDAAIEVCNWVRPWLPLLLALTANSAIHRGSDTGYASWRSVMWGRWPSAGPPPHFDSAAHYDSVVAMMLESGAILDEAMLYWDVRPSIRFPTVEIRVADVPATAAETVLLATLCRAAVMTALNEYERGVAAPRCADPPLRLAYWKAGHDGLDGQAIDVFSDWSSAPTPTVLGKLLTALRPALEELGESARVCAELRRVLRDGNGAMRQRATWLRHHDITEVIAGIAAATLR